MPIASPPYTWPATLDESGPAEDPSRLLTGTAEIGAVSVCIIAIRIASAEQKDVPAEADSMAGLHPELEAFLKDSDGLAARLSDVLGECVPSIVTLESCPYLFWILPLAPQRISCVPEIPTATPESESKLRSARLDRLIAASMKERNPAREATLAQWRTIGVPQTEPPSAAPNAS